MSGRVVAAVLVVGVVVTAVGPVAVLKRPPAPPLHRYGPRRGQVERRRKR